MKKFLALMLAALMMVLPTASLAYDSAVDAAYENGAPVKSVITLTPGVMPGLPEEALGVINDLFNALSIETVSAKTEAGTAESFVLKLQGNDALTVTAEEKDGTAVIASSLLGGQTVKANMDDVTRLMELVNKAAGGEEFVSLKVNGVEVSEEEMMAILGELGMNIVMACTDPLMELMDKMEVTQQTVESVVHDTADAVGKCTITFEELSKLFNAVADGMVNSVGFMDIVAKSGVTDETGAALTGDAAKAEFEKQLRKNLADLVSTDAAIGVTVLMSGEDLVGLELAGGKKEQVDVAQASEEVLAVPEDGTLMFYYRKTDTDGVKHSFNWTINVDNDPMTITATYREAGDAVEAMLSILVDGEEVMFTLESKPAYLKVTFGMDGEAFGLVVTQQEEAVDTFGWVAKVLMIQNSSEMEMFTLVCNGQGGSDWEKIALDLQVSDQKLLTVNTEKTVLDAQAVPAVAAENLVTLADMTDEELMQWLEQAGSNALMGVFAMTQYLPESILSLMMGSMQ